MNYSTENKLNTSGRIYRKEDLDRALGMPMKKKAERGEKQIRQAEETAGRFHGIEGWKFQALAENMETYIPAIERALPRIGMTGARFVQLMKSAVNGTPELAECSWRSVKASMMKCASLGLEPNSPLGQAWMIPRRNHGVLECTFQLGYRGLIALAHRTGEIRTVYADVIRENDEYDYRRGIRGYLSHKPSLQARGKAIAYYAVYEGLNGSYGFEIMSRAEMDEHREKYCGSNRKIWEKNYDEMAKKTVLARLADSMPLSADVRRSIRAEEELPFELERMERDPAPFPGAERATQAARDWEEHGYEAQDFPDYEGEEQDFPEYE